MPESATLPQNDNRSSCTEQQCDAGKDTGDVVSTADPGVQGSGTAGKRREDDQVLTHSGDVFQASGCFQRQHYTARELNAKRTEGGANSVVVI